MQTSWFCVFTGSAFALHYCKAHAKINRKKGNSTPCKIVTPKNFILKLCIRDYVGEITRHANFGFNRYSGGFSPNRRNINHLVTFFDCPVLSLPFFSRSYAQVEPLDRFSRFMAQTTCFAQGWSFWGLERWVTIFGGNMPSKLPKMGVNRQFPAKTAKYKNCNISKTINRIKTKFEDQAETGNCTSWVVQHYPYQIQYGCRRPS